MALPTSTYSQTGARARARPCGGGRGGTGGLSLQFTVVTSLGEKTNPELWRRLANVGQFQAALVKELLGLRKKRELVPQPLQPTLGGRAGGPALMLTRQPWTLPENVCT